jgi:glycerophosphoryl diester phosphodiesterase
MVTAHRAAHTHYPENSLGALQEAIRLGVDIAEVDIRQTKDHVLVIMHDGKVDRTTNGKGVLADLTYQQLMELRLIQDGKPTDEKVPTLEQVLKMAKGKILVDLDFKLGDEDALKRTYKTIEETQTTNQVLFFLYQYKYAPLVHAVNPDVKIMPRAYKVDDVNKILDMKIAKVIHIDEKFYSDTLMKKIRDQHVRVWSNALGVYDDLELSSHTGFKALLTKTKYVNVIQTNLPEEWLKYLKQAGLHN